MQVQKIPFEKTGKFPKLFLDYLNQQPDLKSFYDLFPSEENFLIKANKYSFSPEQRNLLADSLTKQYGSVPANKMVSKNIESLRNKNTFTITTGHQLSLFTGPLYFIYKIITVIKSAKELNEKNPELHFVPVFWMASEDHDFEEINHFYLFNKKFIWETDQKGPVGRFNTSGIEKVFEGLKEPLPEFEKAYLQSKTLSEATRILVNELFGDEGLVIIDGDDVTLKKTFVPVIKEELLEQSSYEKIVSQTSALEKLGYSSQIYPREINLFFMGDNFRGRIIRFENDFRILNNDLDLLEEEVLAFLEFHPEKFSPNVALRPVYQQMILPNVAYCGGPAEINYWLQLKSVFDHYQVDFPILLPRFSAQILNKQSLGKMEKLGVSAEEIFKGYEELKSKILGNISEIETELTEERKLLDDLFEKILGKVKNVDASLEGFVMAEKKNSVKSLENIEKRMQKAEESRNATSLNQLQNLLDKMFPDGQLQERKDNFLNFYINDPDFISELTKVVAPFDFRFNLITHG